MSQPIVLIVFYSRGGSTEKLALAAAVGAVQARASIRLRRMNDRSEACEHSETLGRMHKEYVAVSEVDVVAAHAIIFATPAGSRPADPEWKDFFQLLDSVQSQNQLNGKIAAVVNAGDRDSLSSFQETISRIGFRLQLHDDSTTSTLLERATELGRTIGGMASEV